MPTFDLNAAICFLLSFWGNTKKCLVYISPKKHLWVDEGTDIFPTLRKDEDGEVLIRAVQGHSMKVTVGGRISEGERGNG